MKRTIINYYLGSLVIIFAIFFSIYFNFFSNLNSSYKNTRLSIKKLDKTYTELSEFEVLYMKKQNQQYILYINKLFEDTEDLILALDDSYEDRELKFLLDEINEVIIKHKEAFLRSVVYLNNINESEDKNYYQLNQFNLDKSKMLFYIQKTSYNKKVENFNEALKTYFKNKKLKFEKIGITFFLFIVFIITILLKYIFILEELNGHNTIIKKRKN